jgi:hypothetical protein
VAATVAAVSYVRHVRWSQPRAFDATAWKDESGSEGWLSSRHAMADEVERALVQDQPTRAEVYELLGPPTFAQSGQNDWWTLGAPPDLLWWDGCWLEVSFGTEDRVTEVLVEHETVRSCR